MTRFWFWTQLVGALCCFATAAIEWRKRTDWTDWPTCCAWIGCGMWTLAWPELLIRKEVANEEQAA